MEAGVLSFRPRFEKLWPVVFGLLAYAVVVTCLLRSIDILVDRQPGPDRALWAILDNTIHALVAFLLLLPLFLLRIRSLAVPLLGAVLASLIDLDHFAAAGSISLQAALSLPCRPWTHSLTFVLPAAAIAGLASRRFWVFAVAAAALTSHILRDATCSPTPLLFPLPAVPVPWWLYILVCHLMTATCILASQAAEEPGPVPTLPERLPVPVPRHLRTHL